MSIEKKSENTTATIDKKALFGPLGRYAIIGVIMGSIIVTSAIMLDRQPGSATEHIAAIEKELAELNASAYTTTVETAPANEAAEAEITSVETAPVRAASVAQDIKETATIQTTEVPAANLVDSPVSKQQVQKAVTDTVADTEETVFDENQTSQQVSATAQVTTTEAARTEPVVNSNIRTFAPRHTVDIRDQQWEARIQTRKLEQKQYLAERLDRIKAIDSQRLEEYKDWQDEGVDIRRERLHEQIARQQALIEELILRNKEAYEMREASVRRSQSSREEILDRI